MKTIQRAPVWLPQTQTWLYGQVRHLPGEIESHILCDRTANLDQFALPCITSLKDGQSLRGHFGDEIWRRLLGRPPLAAVIAAARKIGPDLWHSHFGHQGWLDMPVVRRTGAGHIVSFYGYDLSRLPKEQPKWKKRYRALFAACGAVLCEGRHMASCLQKLGCPAGKIRVHHLGIDVRNIHFSPRSFVSGAPLRILIAAAFTEKKGIPYGVEALGKLRGKIDLKITIIGDAKGDPGGKKEKKAILKSLEDSGLAADTEMLGYQPHSRLFEEAYKHHFFLSPSITAASGDTEGGAPVGIIELAATGMPVVSTRHCDIPEVLNYGEEGWLAGERDVGGLVSLIEKWLAQADRWPSLLVRAREHIESEYDAVHQGQRLGQIYREILNRRSPIRRADGRDARGRPSGPCRP